MDDEEEEENEKEKEEEEYCMEKERASCRPRGGPQSELLGVG